VRRRGGARGLGGVPALLVATVLVAGACGGGPILANEPLTFPTPPVATDPPARPADPIPVELPRDDGPHDRLTEWWYYTGHLTTVPGGRRFGFEAVVFRAERGGIPVAWASHLALTDEEGLQFTYAQRSEIGPQVDRSPRGADGTPTGFDLQIAGLNPELVAGGAAPMAATPWRLAGSNGSDRIEAALSTDEAVAAGRAFGLALDLRSTKPAALHDHDGFVDFAEAGSSYYYSRTRLAATGTLTLDGAPVQVEGIAWFDHQWGDFVSVGGGGWNWFAINLDDGTDITISDVLDEQANSILTYGTLVAADGSVRHVTEVGVGANPLSIWTSPRSGRTWTQQWGIIFDAYYLTLESTLQEQELDTRATTGVVYWEGSHTVSGILDPVFDEETGEQIAGTPVAGDAYVEMTRYDAVQN
jgi:predicted secreted hydrolase